MAIVFKTPKSALNTTTKTIQNLANDCPPCPEPVLEKAELEYTQNGEYTVTPEEGVDGFSEIDVTVNIPSDVNNQNKTVNPSTSSQSVSADSGYSGLGTVTVNAVTSSIDANIQAENILDGVTILGVTGTDLGYQAGYDEGEAAGETAGYQTGYEAGYEQGQSECPEPNLSNLNITPSTNSQEYNPAISGVDGYSLVRVNAVTSAIDQNIAAGNIKNGVSILGVTGSYDPQPELQAKTVNPSTSQQTVSPDQGKDGLSSVTVNAVTNAIDADIIASNIKDGVTILGVTGEVVEANFEPNKEFYGDVTGIYTITPQSGYNGFEEVQVTVESNPIGSFWNPFDVSDDTTMGDVYNKLEEGGYFDGMYVVFGMGVDSGSIDSETGYYIAEDGNGNSFAIEPFFDNPDYDPELSPEDQPDVPALIFPENFDLSGFTIQVEADFENVTITENEPEDPNLVPTYTTEIALCVLSGINWNSDMESWPMYWDGTLSGGIETSTRNLHLSTNEPQVMSLSSNEPWEIELDQPQAQSQMNIRPLAKSGLRSAEPTLEIDQMEGNAGVFTLNVLSTSDQATGFTVRGLNSGNEVYVEVNSLGDYFTIESLEDNNNVVWESFDNQHTLEYSIDEGQTWTTTTLTQQGSSYYYYWSLNEGDVILLRGNNERYSDITSPTNKYCRFQAGKTINVSGCLASLLSPTNFVDYQIQVPYVFYGLFKQAAIVDASGLILPVNVSAYCYSDMFSQCSELINAPELPATNMANYCYSNMFNGCTSLTTAPELPAKILANYCYQRMFRGCSSITETPSLPAKYLEVGCYSTMFQNCTDLVSFDDFQAEIIPSAGCQSMFWGCSSLTSVPASLPASIDASSCDSMFRDCTSLTTAPELPATTIGQGCYSNMFRGCTSLEIAPELPATTVQNYCYSNMFDGCTSLTTAPELPATELMVQCYQEMFKNCSNIDEITCLATNISAANCVNGWLSGVSASGTFYKDPSMTGWVVGTNVPSGWTVEDYGSNSGSGSGSGGGNMNPDDPGDDTEI